MTRGGLRTGRLWSWNDKASLLFLRRAYYLILFYSNSSASSVTRRERNPSAGCPALSLSRSQDTLSLSFVLGFRLVGGWWVKKVQWQIA